MTATRKPFISISVLLIILSSASECFAQNQNEPPRFFSDDTWVKITIAVVSAILSFIGSYVLAQVKQKREPIKQLSFDKHIRKGLVEVEADIKEKVQVLYKNRAIENLYHIACNVEHTGNSVIKNQYVRFEFPEEAHIVDYFLEPLPEREMGVEESSDGELKPNEKRYLIKHIERGQQVGFRFLVTAPSNIYLDLHPFNEEGNVEFIPRSISQVRDKRVYLTRFIVLYLIYEFIPPILYILPRQLDDVGVGLVRLAIIVAILPTIKPVARIVTDLISNLALSKSVGESKVNIKGLVAESLNIETTSGVSTKPMG